MRGIFEMNSILVAYRFELPIVGKKEALNRVWSRLVMRGHMPTKILRHKQWILCILEQATAANE
jgi:hypothetical protein